MSTLFARYLELQSQLLHIRDESLNEESSKERSLLSEMDSVWWEMTPEQRRFFYPCSAVIDRDCGDEDDFEIKETLRKVRRNLLMQAGDIFVEMCRPRVFHESRLSSEPVFALMTSVAAGVFWDRKSREQAHVCDSDPGDEDDSDKSFLRKWHDQWRERHPLTEAWFKGAVSRM